MNFKTKFDTGSFVQSKFDRAQPKNLHIFQVMEIQIQRCYTTTQIFYYLRPIIIVHDGSMYNPGNATAHIVSGHSNDPKTELGWRKLREDELIAADKRVVEFINKTPPVHTTILQAIKNTLTPPKPEKKPRRTRKKEADPKSPS